MKKSVYRELHKEVEEVKEIKEEVKETKEIKVEKKKAGKKKND